MYGRKINCLISSCPGRGGDGATKPEPDNAITNAACQICDCSTKELKLPTFLREYGKLAAQCAAEGVSYPDYLLRLAELELTDRHQIDALNKVLSAGDADFDVASR